MNYEQLVTTTPVTLIEFYATWCPHCQRMMPYVAEIKEILQGKADVHQLDVDKNGDLCDREGVESYPTFIIYKDGKEMWRESGEMDPKVLLSKVESYL